VVEGSDFKLLNFRIVTEIIHTPTY
jgi:hypothetical protein